MHWDLIDSSTDAGQDDANHSMSQLVGYFEGMACSGNQGGVDGSCEEHEVPAWCGPFPLPPCECNPATDGDTSPNGTGTRDSYNTYDIAAMVPGDDSSERDLNCVQGAED